MTLTELETRLAKGERAFVGEYVASYADSTRCRSPHQKQDSTFVSVFHVLRVPDGSICKVIIKDQQAEAALGGIGELFVVFPLTFQRRPGMWQCKALRNEVIPLYEPPITHPLPCIKRNNLP